MKRFHHTESARRRGAVVVMTTASLVVIMIFASLAIDVGHICAVAGEMQHSADGAALAGASALRDMESESVYERATDILSRMHQFQGFRAADAQSIETGIWDPITGSFVSLDDSGTSKAFAVRVVSHRPKTQYFFAGIMGKHSADVYREAVAVGSEPCNGIWGLTGVDAGSIVTDSYNSTEGSYNALTVYDNGDICSGRDIKIHGSKVINGDTMPGFGYAVTVKGNSGEITGFTSNTSGDLPEVPVDLGDAVYNNDNDLLPPVLPDGTMWYKKSIYDLDMASGSNLTLPEGTFYFESIKLSGGSTLTITGKTTIYISGSADATGGAILNETKDPHDLTIISMGSDFKLGGGVDIYGTILTPKAYTVLNGSNLYGVVIAGYLELKGNFNVHVDESLPWANYFTAPQPMLVQ